MTYCVGMLLNAGLVLLSDSRTNAGVDHINTFRKMKIFEFPGDRVLVLLAAGNLAITQSLISHLEGQLADSDTALTLRNARSMFDAARCVGVALRELHEANIAAFQHHNVEFNINLILGGQVGRERPRLFHIYAAGNFIEAMQETPYFQIGESKYGKPIIDRVLTVATPPEEAAKLALISMDSTLRSNLSVGLPLDLAIYRRDELRLTQHVTIDSDNAYFRTIGSRWGAALRHAFSELPNPEWGSL